MVPTELPDVPAATPHRQAAMDLGDAQLHELLGELRAVLAPRLALPPAPGRRRRPSSTVLVHAPVPSAGHCGP